jgi:hypothetical protein
MEGVPFVGNDACAHNLLLKGRPLIMRFMSRIRFDTGLQHGQVWLGLLNLISQPTYGEV